MARIFGCTGSNFDANIRVHVSAEHIRKEGRITLFHAPSVIKAWHAAKLAAATPRASRREELDEKLRELKLAKELDQVVSREQVHQGLSLIASVLRTAGEVLQRDFGREAFGVLDDALNEAARLTKDHLGDGDAVHDFEAQKRSRRAAVAPRKRKAAANKKNARVRRGGNRR